MDAKSYDRDKLNLVIKTCHDCAAIDTRIVLPIAERVLFLEGLTDRLCAALRLKDDLIVELQEKLRERNDATAPAPAVPDREVRPAD